MQDINKLIKQTDNDNMLIYNLKENIKQIGSIIDIPEERLQSLLDMIDNSAIAILTNLNLLTEAFQLGSIGSGNTGDVITDYEIDNIINSLV